MVEQAGTVNSQLPPDTGEARERDRALRLESLRRIGEALRFHGGNSLPRSDTCHLEHKELLEKLQEWLRLDSDLLSLSARINEAEKPEELLDRVFDEFSRLLPLDRMGIALLEDGGTVVRSFWSRSDLEVILLGKGFQAPLAGSSLSRILDTGEPRIINDLVEYLRDHPSSLSTSLIVQEGIRSNLTCPLIAGGKPIGFLFFSNRNPGVYREIHAETYNLLAANLSMIVQKALDRQRLVELNDLKNKFLGIAAHDLRSPLAVVKSYLEMLGDPATVSDANQRDRVLGRMNAVVDRMLSMVNDLLDLSAIESGQLQLLTERISWNDLLTEAMENARFLACQKGIEVRGEIPSDLPQADLDRRRILQVLENLVGNALKFSPSGTAVTLRAKPANGTVIVEIVDQGKGIPPEELPKLFREFGRTSVKPVDGEKSTGLGLAIVRKIVESHGGKVGVTSTPGKGSTFWFRIPSP